MRPFAEPALTTLAMTMVLVAAGALLLFGAERAAPLRTPRRTWLLEVAINLAFSALAFGSSAVLVRPAVGRAMGWSQRQEFGLVYLAGLPPWARGVLVFVLLDLAFYYWHRLNHELPVLWRFHNVHHCDPGLDVSTSFRFHFGEVALSTVFRVIQITVIGASLPVYAAYELAFQLTVIRAYMPV